MALAGKSMRLGAQKTAVARASRTRVVRVNAAAAGKSASELGIQEMRSGIKVAADETILTPRFYTT